MATPVRSRLARLSAFVSLGILAASSALNAQAPITYTYVHDAAGRLIRAVDSTGVSVQYNWDAAGNLIGTVHSGIAAGLSILSFSPAQGGPGTVVAIQGQGFSPVVANNAVTFNGVPATITGATATTLVVTVPATATTGTIAVTTGASNATSATAFTVLPIPQITGISTRYLLAGQTGATITLAGVNLTSATFSVQPATSPAALVITNAATSANSATLTVSTGAVPVNAAIVATNSAGSSTLVAGTANSVSVLLPNIDSDGDGLSNAAEIQAGTDPLNPDTDGDGMWDGWELKYGLNPLDPTDAAKLSKAADGLTNLQEFLGGTDPTNTDRTLPSVTSVTPANNATGLTVNSTVTVNFNTQVLTAAQAAALAVFNPNVTQPAISVSNSAGPVAGTIVTYPNGLTFTPSQNLTISTTYTISVTGFRTSTAGVAQSSAFTSTFTTGSQPDTNAPTVIRTNPSNDWIFNTPLNTPISIEFSKAMDPATLNSTSFQVNFGLNTLTGRYQLDSTGRIATFYPTSPLPAGPTLNVTLNQHLVMDTAGNSLASPYTFSFTTGLRTDSTPPAVVTTNPFNGDTGLPVNVQIMIRISEPLNEISAVHGISIMNNGSPIPGTFAFNDFFSNQGVPEAHYLMFVPTNPLYPAGVTTVSVANVTDIAGNALPNSTWSFTVDSPEELVGPPLVAYSPPSGAPTGLNPVLEIRMAERINPVTLYTFLVSGPGAPGNTKYWPGTVTVAPDRLSATYTFPQPPQPNTQYCWEVPLYNVAGLLGGMDGSCFTTATTADTTAPAVTGVNPPNGSSNIPLNAVIAVQSSKPLSTVSLANHAATAFTLMAGGTPVPGTASLSVDGLTLSFTPTAQLSPGVTYTITVGAVADYEGNVIAPFTSTFTTGTAADTTPLGITSFAPADGSTSVPVNSSVVISFNKLIDPIAVNSSSVRALTPQNVALAGTYTVDNSGAFGIVTFKPSLPFPGGTVITVIVSNVQDFVGNTIAGSESFITAAFADTMPPVITSVTPTSGASGFGPSTLVSLTFSKPLNPGTVNANNFSLFSGHARLATAISSSQDFQTVTLAAAIPPSATISITATHDVQDLAGNALADFTSVFTSAPTPDVNSPTIVSQRPGFGNSGVPASALIVLFASKPLNPSTVTGAVIVTQNGLPVTGTVSLSGNNQAITFTPAAPWAAGATVQIFVDSTATDVTGNPMTVYQGSFTTAPDLTNSAPTVTASLPVQNAPAVSLNALIEIRYSKPLDPSSLAGNVSLATSPGNNAVTAAVSLADSRTILIAPSAPLLPSTQYQIAIGTGIKDLTGLSPAFGNTFTFTTGTAADTAQPRVAAITPPDASVNIGTNAPVEVRFNKPVNPLSVTTSTVQITAGGNPLTLASVNMVGTSNQDFQIVPFGLLPDATKVTIAVSGVQDLSGNVLVAATAAFTTRTGFDLTRAQVISSNPPSGASDVPINTPFTFQFNKPIDPYTVTSANIVIRDESTNQQVAGALSLSANALQVSFAPAAPLAVGRNYSVVVSNGVHDLLGNAAGFSMFITTGFSASTSTPHVMLTNPDNGLSSVPTNAVIHVLFDEPLQNSSIGSVSLMADGVPVSGTVYSLDSGNTLLTMTPPALMLPGTTYTINVAGVIDIAGNTIAQPYSGTFTTAAGVRLVPTTYLANPAAGTANAGTNTIPSIAASYRLDPTTVNSSTLSLFSHDLNSLIAGVVAPSADRLSATYTPSAPLRANTSYCLEVNGITDEAGAAISGATPSCFTTAAGSDTTSPTVLLVSPPDKSVNIPVNATVSILSNKPLNAGTVTSANIALSNGSASVAGTLALASDFETIAFTPSGNLTAGATYTLTVSGVTDIAGNPIQSFTSSFQTNSDSTPVTSTPTAISTSPAGGATNVPNNSTISITFDRPMNPVSINGSSIPVTANSAAIAGIWAVAGATATFTPSSPFPANASVTVTIGGGVFDLSGNAAAQESFSFTAAASTDATLPVITSITPASGATGLGVEAAVTVTFSKSIDPSTITAANFALFAGAARLTLSSLTWSQDNTSVSFNASPLPGNATITVVITHGVLDLSGNALGDYSSTFTTAPIDITRPQVTLTRPGSGATDVPAGSPVVVFFSAPMDASSTQASITVSQNGNIVAGTSVLAGGGQVLTFTPSVPFTPGALVQVFISSAALSRSGNSLYPSVSSFTIAPDLTNSPPVVTGVSPGQSDFPPVNSVIQVRFSKPLDPSTVNSAALTLTPLGGSVVAGNVTLVGGNTLQLVPSAPLSASTSYLIQVPGTVKDTTGLNLAAPFVTSTATGTATESAQPRVIAVTPPDKSTGIGENAPLHLQFSEYVNTLTANSGTIQLAVGGNPVIPVNIAYGLAGDVTVTPFAALPDASQVTVTVSGIQDEAGNMLIPFTSSFTTGSTPIFAGTVVATTPLAGAANVPVNAIVTIETNDPVDPASVSANAFVLTDTTTNARVPGTYSVSTSGKVVTFAPTSPLNPGDTFNSFVNLLDLEGNSLNSSFTFTASNAAVTTPPSVLLVNPPNGFDNVPTDIVPQVLFSEPVDIATIGAVTLSSGATTLNITAIASNGNQTVSLVPPGLLQPSTLYTITVGAVSDTSGNVIATPLTYTFTTGAAPSLANPSVASFSPANNATGVSLTPVISAVFSVPLNPLTVTASAFQLTDPSSVAVAGALALSPDGLTVTLTPTAALAPNATYQLSVSNITDLAGNTVTAVQSTFTTGAQ